ncbi:lysine N(6)-hydroxylase/L-ornithine N(5)-oxygenase family protein [Kocuria sp. SM24M-10]|uniref:lysine N(6)-hydroxylase/L-ornithine N(5)-oxygenase family protein n=1 Tax=Kocuria sp. SM24M-10 TaxID=1660349 RepID=UPI00064A9297|nr:SidA/IucD/PvdA family monooxygenase [Kocuria sp. SM24M-10]KLU11419.1 L-lysine 6-monooxygenase [Kocuria sp. SM24M-10]
MAAATGRVHDLLGIGIGPFNLGLACLAAPLEDLDAVFLDAREGFDWHPGLMLEDATIQVPFLADLVTLADPTSPWSFLNYLKRTGRLYPFYIREDFNPLRAEYSAYCRWASERLESLHWGREVVAVERDAAADAYTVTARTRTGTEQWRTRRLVLGVGTVPWVPAGVEPGAGPVLHTSDYLPRREELLGRESVTVLGSGQSAAEVYRDLLERAGADGPRVDWITRSPRFFPMEYTKLTLEMTSPEYVDHFHGLDRHRRDRLNREHTTLYKGISTDLVNGIHELLYRRSVHGHPAGLLTTNTSLTGARWDAAAGTVELALRDDELERCWQHTTGALVLATGYRPEVPAFLDPVREEIAWDAAGRYDVSRDYAIDRERSRIWVQNAEVHTHGLTAPDLGMGAYRNSVILRAVTGREVYPVEPAIAFQTFGIPQETA